MVKIFAINPRVGETRAQRKRRGPFGAVRAFYVIAAGGLGGLGDDRILGDDLGGLRHHRHRERGEQSGGGEEAEKLGHGKLPETGSAFAAATLMQPSSGLDAMADVTVVTLVELIPKTVTYATI